jgi:predicted HicB family RNase H-like nuclease
MDIQIELDDKTILALALEAHRQDITLNQLCNNILKEFIDKENAK